MFRFPAIASLLFLLTPGLVGSCAAPQRDVRTATIEAGHLSYRVLGSGHPVLVMISGLGDGMNAFEDVAPRLAEHATVIIYDRAGYGGSSAVGGPRDAVAADRELSALLAQVGVERPYYVLGHSVGGMFAEYFAAHHPDEVEGLILVDSRPGDFTRRCEAAGIDMCAAPAALMMFYPRGAQDEFAALEAIGRQVEASTRSTRPTLVISQSLSDTPSAFDRLWAERQTALAERYDNGRHEIAPSGGHYVHQDAEDWFVSTVTTFMQASEAAS